MPDDINLIDKQFECFRCGQGRFFVYLIWGDCVSMTCVNCGSRHDIDIRVIEAKEDGSEKQR